MTLNVNLLQRTLDFIEEHPDKHDQEHWRCGTSACFAGWAVTLDGGVWVHDQSEYLLPRDDDPDADVKYLGHYADVKVVGDQGKGVHVADRAQRILGLLDSQVEDLFADDNDLEDLRELVGLIIEGAS